MALGGHASVAAAQAGAAPAFEIGDAVRITIWDYPDLSGEFEIGERGVLLHPLYQRIQIAGMTLDQANAAVGDFLRNFQSVPEFIIEPLFRIPIGGEVGSPGFYTLASYQTVPQAITLAGGTGPEANLQRVRVLRDGATLYVDISRPYQELADWRVQAGDQIIVDRRRNIWRNQISPFIQTAGSLASITFLVLRISRVLN